MYLSRVQNIYLGVTTLIIITAKYSAEEFTITPSAEALPVGIGEEAVFRCQNIGARFVFWNFNGSMVTQDPPPYITPAIIQDENNHLVYTLTIIAHLELNGTQVECGAILQDGSTILTPSVELIIAGNGSATTHSNDAILVRVTPDHPVLTVASGETVILRCHRPNATIGWSVNETTLGSSTFKGLVFNSTSHSFLNGSQIQLLIFTADESYSGISITCIASFDVVGQNPEETPPIRIVVQGVLDGVSNISRIPRLNLISWCPSTSANLSNVEPSIIYCLEVFNNSCGNGDSLINICNLTEPRYIYGNDELYPHKTYDFTVIPRSNVEGASNGSAVTKNEVFRFWDELPKIIIQHQNRSNLVNVEIYLDDTYEGDIEPESYSLLMHPIDNAEESEQSSESVISLRKNNSYSGTVLSTIQPLPVNRLWRSSVITSDCSNSVTTTFIISTHSIQNVSVYSPLPGEIEVNGCLIHGSNGVGALVIVYSSRRVYYSFSTPQAPNQCVVVAKVSGLAKGHYQVSLFMVEEGGLPFNRSAIVPQNITIDQEGTEQEDFLIEYELSSTATGVCVHCIFLESTLTECVVVVHQRISQLSPPGLINIESSHRFNRSGNTAYGCIDGLMTNSTDYRISVVGGNLTTQVQGESGSFITAGIVVPTCILLGVLLLVAVPVVTCCIIMYRKKRILRPYTETVSRAPAEVHETTVVCGPSNMFNILNSRSPGVQSIPEESIALLPTSPIRITLVSDSHYQATPTVLREEINHDDHVESEDMGSKKLDVEDMENLNVTQSSSSGARSFPRDINEKEMQDADPSTIDADKDSILEQTVVKEVNYIEEIPLSNPIILEAKSPEEASKAKAPDPVQNESESHMALNAPKSSGEKLEPTPVSRRDIQPCHLQTYRDTTDELTLSPEDEGVWQQKASGAMVGPGYPPLV